MPELSPVAEAFWSAYLRSLDAPEAAARRLYGACRIGDSKESADEGAGLVLSGRKTASSSLLWDYESSGRPPPSLGALSILEDGEGRPVCIFETTEVEVRPFDAVDAAFAADYGEWDGSLATWRRECWQYYAAVCAGLGREPAEDMPLVCERLRIVYPG